MGGGGLQVVVGDLCQPLAGHDRRVLLQRPGDGIVQRQPAPARDRVIQRRLDEAVVEAVAVGVVGGRAHEPQPDRLVEQLEELHRRRAGGRGQRPRPELLADHRRDAQYLATRGREHRQTGGDGIAHAGGQGHRAGGYGGVVELVLGLDQAEQLGHEQGVAAGELVDAVDESIRRGEVSAALDHAAHVGGGQALEHDPQGGADQL